MTTSTGKSKNPSKRTFFGVRRAGLLGRDTGRRTVAVAAAVGIAASLTVGVNVATAPSAAAQPTSFQCTTDGILTQSGSDAGPQHDVSRGYGQR